jgi:hypothetical protein
MRRRLEVDALRGLMLVWMTLTHLPTSISAYSYQPIGFVSSAEGFIFLSALFTGLIYFRTALRDGFPEMRLRLWGRTLKIYVYHMLMIGTVFLLAPIIAGVNHPGLHNLLDYYFSVGPKHAAVDAVFLGYRPPLLDILPMYVIFMGLSPLIMTAARRIGWRFIMTGSFALWLMAQLGLRELAYVWMRHAGLRIPLNEMGAFDMWAWQLVWLTGLWCGVRWAQDDLPITDWARKITAPAALIVVSLMALRYSLNYGVDLGGFEPFFDKWHLGVVRLVEFVCVASLLIRFQSFLKPLAVRPLILLGQASLPVFCTHLVFCFLGLAIMRDNPIVVGWEQVALPVITFTALYAVAKKVGDGKNKSKRSPASISFAPAPSR